MKNKRKQKRRLGRSLARRREQILAEAWRNIFVKAGVLKK